MDAKKRPKHVEYYCSY